MRQNKETMIWWGEAFPPYGYGFADGPMSAYVNVGAELCFLSYIAGPFDLMGWPVHFFPLVARETFRTDTVYSPFLRFQSRRSGRDKHALFWPGATEIYPFGFSAKHLNAQQPVEMDFVTDENSLTFLFRDTHPEKAVMRIYMETAALNRGEIVKKSTGYGVGMTLSQPEVRHDQQHNLIIGSWKAEYRDTPYDLFLVLGEFFKESIHSHYLFKYAFSIIYPI